jgi:hypothetical protein
MWDKLKNDKFVKELLVKSVTILFIAAIALLLYDVLTQSKDGRKQIVDMDGGTEYTEESSLATDEELRLGQILSKINGAGDTSVMITYQTEEEPAEVFSGESSSGRKVEGVIVISEGAGDFLVKTTLIDAVSMLFDIPATNVAVYEKRGSSIE